MLKRKLRSRYLSSLTDAGVPSERVKKFTPKTRGGKGRRRVKRISADSGGSLPFSAPVMRARQGSRDNAHNALPQQAMDASEDRRSTGLTVALLYDESSRSMSAATRAPGDRPRRRPRLESTNHSVNSDRNRSPANRTILIYQPCVCARRRRVLCERAHRIARASLVVCPTRRQALAANDGCVHQGAAVLAARRQRELAAAAELSCC